MQLHFVREKVEKGRVKLFKVDTAENPANMLTKPLGREEFEFEASWYVHDKHGFCMFLRARFDLF